MLVFEKEIEFQEYKPLSYILKGIQLYFSKKKTRKN